jgi:hypothetical protein
MKAKAKAKAKAKVKVKVKLAVWAAQSSNLTYPPR